MRFSSRVCAGVMILLLAGCDSQESENELDVIRDETTPFQSLDAAREAGYTVWAPDPTAENATCASSAEGKMGYHLVNPSLRGSPADPEKGDVIIASNRPEMLLYEKLPDGTMRLVGVEYLVFKAAWEREHGAGAAAPTVFGQPLLASRHAFVAGGSEIEHYELHVWLHSDNPNGMFSPWNPDISC